MENSTVSDHFPRNAANESVTAGAAPARGLDSERLLAGIWFALTLIGLAAIGLVFSNSGGLRIYVGWASFTAVNCALCCAVGARYGPSRHAPLALASAGIAGLAWGAGSVLLIPIASPSQLSVLLSAQFCVALASIPLLVRQPARSSYFLATLVVVTGLALMHEDHIALSAIWLVFGGAALAITRTVYRRNVAHLVHRLDRLLVATGDERADEDRRSTAQLTTAVERRINALRESGTADNPDRRVLDALGDGVISTDHEGRITYLNPVAEILLGAGAEHLAHQPIEYGLRIVLPADELNLARAIFEHANATQQIQRNQEPARLVRRDGTVYGVDYVVTPISGASGEFAGATFLIRDVTEQRRRADTLSWQTTHDPLTGVINRAEFELHLKRLIHSSHGDSSNSHALLCIDVDKFKFINDNYGHAAGDATLRSITDVLRTRMRRADMLARIGGDEFSALLYSCSAAKARLIADAIRIAVERHAFVWQGVRLPVSLNIAVVEINRTAAPADIMRAVDSACRGDDKTTCDRLPPFYRDEANRNKGRRNFDVVKYIQFANRSNRLELFYQPVHATDGNATCHCKLSVGIRNQVGEVLPREEILDLSRDYELTDDIDLWTITTVVDALTLNRPPLDSVHLVLIPLSQRSLADTRLLNYIEQLIKDNDFDATRLGFALEDGGSLAQIEPIRHFVMTLKSYGCPFMLGDLGIGSQTIEVAKFLQADFLGIRASLVHNMLHSSADREVVLGISRIARALGMQTIAEQAETRAQRDALKKMGVEFITGELHEDMRQLVNTRAAHTN